jgi:hypothetical protein
MEKSPKGIDKQRKQISGQIYQIDILPINLPSRRHWQADFLSLLYQQKAAKRLSSYCFNHLWVDTKTNVKTMCKLPTNNYNMPQIAVLSGYITTWNKQAETRRCERMRFVKRTAFARVSACLFKVVI